VGVATTLLVAAALGAGGGAVWPSPGAMFRPATVAFLPLAPDAPPAQQQAGEVIVEIRFRGNYSIADEELLAATGVQPGDPISPTTLEEIARRLRDTEGVGEVEILKRYRSMERSNEVVLLINVTEHVAVSEKFMFLPVFTWTDEYGVTFGARFATVDLLGLDERLSFPLTWGGERRAAAEVDFDLARAAITRAAGGFGILQRENPHFELADRRVGAWAQASKRWQLFELDASLRAAEVDFGDAEETQLEVGVGATIDTRQDAQLPRDAFYIGGAWDHLQLFDSEQGFNRFTVDLRGYKTFLGRSIIAAQGYYRGADGRLPDWERPFLGGAQTVRGYDAGAFIGDNIALLSAEWRVPLTPPVPVGLVGLNFFFDSGTVYDHGTSLGKARFKNGAGAGIYFFVAFVGLQVDVAYGFDSDEVHFHFSTGFRF
jgi:outer membrane protein assembly factor BamA